MPLHNLYLIANSMYYVRYMFCEIEIFTSCNTQQFHAVNVTNNTTTKIVGTCRYIHGVTKPDSEEFFMVNR